MTVQQLQAILQTGAAQSLQQLEDAGRGKAELGTVAAGVLPVAGRSGRQAHPQAKTRPQLHFSCHADDQFQLGKLLDDKGDTLPEPLCMQREADVFRVLVAVADNDAVDRRNADDRQQLRLAAGLETDTFATVTHNRIHHVLLLVDLDGIDGGVARSIVVSPDCRLEGAAQAVDLLMQNIGKAHQHRPGQARIAHRVGQCVQVHLGTGFLARGPRDQVPALADVKVAGTPAGDIVLLTGIVTGPGHGGNDKDRCPPVQAVN